MHTQSPVALAISSPTFFGDRPRGPILGARAEEAPTSPPVALKVLQKYKSAQSCHNKVGGRFKAVHTFPSPHWDRILELEPRMSASHYIPRVNGYIRIVRRQCSKCRRWSKKMSKWRSRSSEAAVFVGASGFRFSVMSHSQSRLQRSIAFW